MQFRLPVARKFKRYSNQIKPAKSNGSVILKLSTGKERAWTAYSGSVSHPVLVLKRIIWKEGKAGSVLVIVLVVYCPNSRRVWNAILTVNIV